MSAPTKPAMKILDPEAILKRKFQMKCRFRALVRKVMANVYWLTEDEVVYEGDNVHRRIEQAMRKTKQKLLTLTDKALLNKPVADRTDVEKKYIYRKIGNLKCFKRYPNHVKRKLAAATYFKYFGPNRVVVRQDQEAHALYFVLSGEVNVSVLAFDELLKKQVPANVYVMHSGDMFGEVSLLHNIKRTATCVTSGHCEFLVLLAEDFKAVLQKSLQKQWNEIKLAMDGFTYFNGLDEVSRREGCIVAKMKSYEQDDIILGDGIGLPNYVYFVLSGQCQMIELLHVVCNEVLGKTYYTLYDPLRKKSKDTKSDESDIPKRYFRDIKTYTSSYSANNSKNMVKSTSKPDGNIISKTEIEKNKEVKRSILSKNDMLDRHKDRMETTAASAASDTKRKTSYVLPKKRDSEPVELSHILLHVKEDVMQRESFKFSFSHLPDKTIKTFFMQVCIFNPKSTFGFGENMRDRRIVALTKVECMVIPMVWLWQKNPANIWSRVQHYLEKTIPTKKQLFEHFVHERRWTEWRDSIVEEIASRSKTANHITLHDVPYSIRMQEMLDI